MRGRPRPRLAAARRGERASFQRAARCVAEARERDDGWPIAIIRVRQKQSRPAGALGRGPPDAAARGGRPAHRQRDRDREDPALDPAEIRVGTMSHRRQAAQDGAHLLSELFQRVCVVARTVTPRG